MTTITLNVKTIHNHVDQFTVYPTSTFKSLKDSIAACNRVDVSRIRLICSGKVMKDDDTFVSAKLNDGDYIILHIISEKPSMPSLGKSFESVSEPELNSKSLVNSVVSTPQIGIVSEKKEEVVVEESVDLSADDQQVVNTIEKLLSDPEQLRRILLAKPEIANLFNSHGDASQAIMAQMMGGVFADPNFPGANFSPFGNFPSSNYDEDEESYEDSEPQTRKYTDSDSSSSGRGFQPEFVPQLMTRDTPTQFEPRLSLAQMAIVNEVANVVGVSKQEAIQFCMLTDFNAEAAINMILNN